MNSRGDRRVVLALAGIMAVVFFRAAERDILTPAPSYQEAVNVLVPIQLWAGRTLHRDLWISARVAGGDIFLAYNEYVSMAVETYLLWPLFKIFGCGIAVWRTAGILLALAAWIVYALTAAEIFGACAGLSAFALLLFHSTLFLFSRVGMHSELSALWFLSGLTWWCAVKWKNGAGPRWAYAAAFLVGLGTYEKIQFLWIAGALGIGYMPAYARADRAPLPPRRCLWFLALGAAPLAAANIVNPLCTARVVLSYLSHPAQGTSNAHYLSHVGIRFEQFYLALTHGPEMFSLAPNLVAPASVPLVLILLCFLPFVFRKIPRAGLWLLFSVPAYLALSSVNGTGLQSYHVLIVVPALLVFCAGAIARLAQKRWIVAIVTGLCLWPHALTIERYFDYFRATGGRGEASLALYDLERACLRAGILSPVSLQSVAVEQLETASGGAVVPRDAARLRELWPEWFADPSARYVVPAPDEFGTPPAYAEHDFAAAAKAKGLAWIDCLPFPNAEGRIVYSLCRLSPEKAAVGSSRLRASAMTRPNPR